MSTAREKLAGGQQVGSGVSGPKLDVKLWLSMAADTKGNPAFTWYDKDKKEQKQSKKAITGMFLGSAMKVSAFSRDLGPNGGFYRSSVYFNREMPIQVWSRSAKGAEKLCEGNLELIEEKLGAVADDKPSKKQVIFILTSKGVYAIETNLSLAIEQISSALKTDEKLFSENFMELTPEIYDPEDKSISEKCKTFLGPFAPKNPPKYAAIGIDGEISDEDLQTALPTIEQYAAWKAHKIGGSVTQEKKEEPLVEGDIPPREPVASAQPPAAQLADPMVDEEDDLPF